MNVQECETFVDAFLKKNDFKCYVTDYNQYFGELMWAVLKAVPRYKPELGAKLSTYLHKVCLSRLGRVKAQERAFYAQHTLASDMSRYPDPDKGAFYILQQEEMLKMVKNTPLPNRTKEVVSLMIIDPLRSQSDIARELGVTRSAVNLHFQSAKQFLARQNIFLS